jgi:glutathione S-transferase
MILFYMPGACSLAVHIALREAGLPFELAEVSYAERQLRCGGDFRAINSKAYVPALKLDDGSLLTEVPVILQYIDAVAPGVRLLPAAGSLSRYRALEWLNYVATEIHKSFSPLFRPSTPHDFLEPGRNHLAGRLDIVEARLAEMPYLSGARFCSADAYLFACCRWLGAQNLAIADWPALARHFSAVGNRTTVEAALAAEGLPMPEPVT